jgi:hypothetical protein
MKSALHGINIPTVWRFGYACIPSPLLRTRYRTNTAPCVESSDAEEFRPFALKRPAGRTMVSLVV